MLQRNTQRLYICAAVNIYLNDLVTFVTIAPAIVAEGLVVAVSGAVETVHVAFAAGRVAMSAAGGEEWGGEE